MTTTKEKLKDMNGSLGNWNSVSDLQHISIYSGNERDEKGGRRKRCCYNVAGFLKHVRSVPGNV